MLESQSKNFQKLAHRLFEQTADRELFSEAVTGEKSSVPALIWMGEPEQVFAAGISPVWLPSFVTTVIPNSGAGSHELHEKGRYYCLDLSSVFQGAPLFEIRDQISTVVDMCASPGGKSILSWRTFHPDLLICNEVIGKRIGALVSNLERCKISAHIINSDVGKIAEAWPGTADLVLVDAPCSGQSLVARGIKAPSCFHPATMNMNSNRQKRILANAGAISRPGGYVLYTTCTFAYEENEGVLKWFMKKFPHFSPVEVSRLEKYRSNLINEPCYRLFPQLGEGAGGFTVLLQNISAGDAAELDLDRLRIVKTTSS